METKARALYFSTSALIVAACVFGSTLFVPAPVQAQCKGCTWDLYCVGGSTCWLIEYCTEQSGVVFEVCGLDQFGFCYTDGSHCLWAGLPSGDGLHDALGLFRDIDRQPTCQVSQVAPDDRFADS